MGWETILKLDKSCIRNLKLDGLSGYRLLHKLGWFVHDRHRTGSI
jgi:hypothetical protein